MLVRMVCFVVLLLGKVLALRVGGRCSSESYGSCSLVLAIFDLGRANNRVKQFQGAWMA